MGLITFQRSVLSAALSVNEEQNLKGLTGEKNLTITKDELIERIEKINSGYLEVMQEESRILER